MPPALLGELLLRQGEAGAAVAPLRRAVERRPDWGMPTRLLGRALVLTNDVQGALDLYGKALARQPGNAELLLDLGGVYVAAGRYDAALEAYGHVLDLDIAANNYAALIADHAVASPERLKQALVLMDRFRTSDDPIPLDTLGWLSYRLGDDAAAVAFLDRAVAGRPDDPQLRYHLAMALHHSGRDSEARTQLQKALDGQPHYQGLDEARDVYKSLQASLDQPVR